MNKKVNVCAIKPKAGYSFDVFIEDLNEDLKPDDGVLDAVQDYFEYCMKNGNKDYNFTDWDYIPRDIERLTEAGYLIGAPITIFKRYNLLDKDGTFTDKGKKIFTYLSDKYEPIN
ncbi:hypothetical protein AAHE33_000458 [Klebsiella aerogenes]|uniref:hypothetical protein n=1 Tax=Klebsiella aerogenes TaxID=548 RepID=UPI0007AA17ED|nr:hypothetical protein [Klebsiella aerogenes]ATX88167.1 hypothetical protein AM345_15250 [Klebsiella aerogenes]SAJ14502.1 Uncharacterised protein [Klebsiella aerogenes]